MKNAEEKHLFEGIKVGKYGEPISHLQYADDVVFFGQWKSTNFRNLLKILECFQRMSGLKMNAGKSKLFGLGVAEETVRSWATSAGCGQGKFPFTYLGLPVGASMKRLDHWNPAMDKFKRRLEAWGSRFVSFGGRHTLVKSVLGSLPLYFFSLFRAPRGVIKECKRLRCRFFWGGGGGESTKKGGVRVKWQNALKKFESGGLNIGSLDVTNLSLLAKWWWRFLVEKDSLWVKVITNLYGEGGGIFDKNPNFDGAGTCWSNIIKLGAILDGKGIGFSNSLGKQIGDGKDTELWYERWLGSERLQDVFPRLFRLEDNKRVSIAERGERVGGEWKWTWGWRRTPRGREVGELDELLNGLQDISPIEGKVDKPIWRLDDTKVFSVKKLRDILESQEGHTGVCTKWLKIVPKKICIFMWRVRLGRIPCRDNLDRMGIDLNSTLCPRCGDEVETIDHALVTCPEVKRLWSIVGN